MQNISFRAKACATHQPSITDSAQDRSTDVHSMTLDALLNEIGVKDHASFLLQLARLGNPDPSQDFKYAKREDQGGRIVLDPGQGVENWVDTLVKMGELGAALALANMMGGTNHEGTLTHLFECWADKWPARADEAIQVAVELASSRPSPYELLLGLAKAADSLSATPSADLSASLVSLLEKACDELLANGDFRRRDARDVMCCAHYRTLLFKEDAAGAVALFNKASDKVRSMILESLILMCPDPKTQRTASHLFNAVPLDVVRRCLDNVVDHAGQAGQRDLFGRLMHCRDMFRGIEVTAGLVALEVNLLQDLQSSKAITSPEFFDMSMNLANTYDVVHPELLRQLGVADPQSFLQATNRDAQGCIKSNAQRRLNGLLHTAGWTDLADKLVLAGDLEPACRLARNCGPDRARILIHLAKVSNRLAEEPLRKRLGDLLEDTCSELLLAKRLSPGESADVLYRAYKSERLAILRLSQIDMDAAAPA